MSAQTKVVAMPRDLGMGHFKPSQVEMIKNTLMKGATDDELMAFIYVCKHTRLDPFLKQIFPVSRYDSKLKQNVWTFQTSIDGYRLVAERTGNYCPGRETTYTYDKEGKLLTATSYVKKMTKDGTWHELSATAVWSEYAQTYIPKNNQGQRVGEPELMGLWGTKPHIMLGKCAEGLSLRKAFPNDLSNLYVEEEMHKDKELVDVRPAASDQLEKIAPGDAMILSRMLEGSDDYRSKLLAHYKANSIEELPMFENDGKSVFKNVSLSIERYIELTNKNDIQN